MGLNEECNDNVLQVEDDSSRGIYSELAPPGDDSERAPPGEERAPPGEERAPPGQERAPPGEERAPPGEERAPPGEESVPPGVNYSQFNSELAPPGRTARCGQSTFPPASQVLTSDGVVTVTFKSRRNSGKSRFRLMVTGAVPKACPGKWNAQGCPNGPCCSGKDCCIIQAGKEPKG